MIMFPTMLLNAGAEAIGKSLPPLFTQTANSNSVSGYNLSQLPMLRQEIARAQQSSGGLQSLFQNLSGQRQAQLEDSINRELANAQGYGLQNIADINQRYNSMQGGASQSAASRGLYNSTALPGMRALVERERNAAIGQERGRQQSYIGNILGQRTQLFDRNMAEQNQRLAGLGSSNYSLNTLIPQTLASSRVTNTTNTTPGLFDRNSGLFGLLSKLF